MKPVTIRDIARQAGVGLGTVSRVINDSPLVSDATRAQVQAVIDELNFTPNPTARRLSLGKTLTIVAIVPFFTRPSFIERLRGVELTLAESEYALNIYNVETVERRDQCIREVPRKELADGILIFSLSPRDSDIPYLTRTDVPIVLLDANHPSLTSLSRVIVDDVEGGRVATQHLIDLGHRRIGYISDLLDNPFNFTSSRDRYTGYLKALQTAGIPFRPEYHEQAPHGRYEARRVAAKMLSLSERPTAIFAASDTLALGILEAAQDCDLRIPDDLSLISYDDIEVAEYLGLTTIRQLLFESGQKGVDLLLKTLEGKLSKPVCEVLPTELIIRRTTVAWPG
jgi:DNA-binding LacI/PurR family transcriptional regulator